MFKKIEKVVGILFIITSFILCMIIFNKCKLMNILLLEYIENFPTFCLSIVLLICGIFLLRGDN